MKYNKAVIVDLECACWPEPDVPTGEIIEIGVCLFDKGELSKKESILVKPLNPDISTFCTELTGHTWQELKSNGAVLYEAINRLKKNYTLLSCPWISWGDFDRIAFVNECSRKGIEYPFGRCHINLKAVYGLLKGQAKGFGVARALKDLGLEFEGRPHNGADDAYNIGRILKEIKNRWKA